MENNYYSILNLKRHCEKEDVHKAFGKLVSKYSIVNQVQDHSLIALCEAYEVLSVPFRRALYDQYGKDRIKKGIQFQNKNIDPWVYHGDVISTYLEYCVLKNPISHLFIKANSSLSLDLKKNFGCPNIVKSHLKLTLKEIFDGTIKLIPVKRKSIQISDSITNEMQIVKVRVPRGFPTGGTLKSDISNADTELKDVQTIYMFTTEDMPHKVFKRDNRNLIITKNVSLRQALCGIQININTLDHKVLRVNITQVIRPDYIKIIHNEGMPDMNDPTQRGNIIIKFDINYPVYLPVLDEKLKEILNKNPINS